MQEKSIHPFSLLRSLALVLCLQVPAGVQAKAVVNHAPLATGHVQVAEQFKAKHFQKNGDFNSSKIRSFMVRLEREKKALASDMYETKMIEDLEFNAKKKYKKVHKKALKRMSEKKEELLDIYQRYLFPKLKQMLTELEGAARVEVLEGLYDQFINIYTVYYLPNSQRGPWWNDYGLPSMLGKALRGFKFKKSDSTKLEANNLAVDASNQKAISSCLERPVSPGEYLQEHELVQLRDQCRFDLSLLNPGSSPMWRPLKNKGERLQAMKTDLTVFPKNSDKLYYDSIRWSGAGSPKFNAEYFRQGKKYKIKVKVGNEVHSEPIVSHLFQLAGMNQDKLKWIPRLRVYLKDKSFEEFRVEWINKYSAASFMAYVKGHGGSGDEQWFEIEDALMEGRGDDEIRLEAFNPDGWDLRNRREYRSLILLYGWLNVLDTRPGNYKVLLKKQKNGQLSPLHRLQDVGASLGRSAVLKKPLTAFHEARGYGVNFLEPEFIDIKKKYLRLWYVDFVNQKGRFETATYSDLKWMARQVATISEKEIDFVIRQGGVPDAIVELLRSKLYSRRNNIVRAFDLQNEYPLYEQIDLAQYSPNRHIKRGKVVTSVFEGHNDLEQNRSNILTTLFSLASFQIPLQKLQDNFDLAVENAGVVQGHVTPVRVNTVGVGIGLTLGREVNVNPDAFTNGETARNYYVRDTLGIEINVGSFFFKVIEKIFPIIANVEAGFTVWRKEIQFTQTAESLAEGYAAPLKILKALVDLKNYIAYSLNPGEVIKVLDGYGFEVTARVGVLIGGVITNEINGSVAWRYTSPVYFYRNQFGQLKIYKEKSHTLSAGMGIQLGAINLYVLQYPIIGLEFTYQKFWAEGTLYSFKLPAYSLGGEDALDEIQRKRDYQALQVFFSKGGADSIEAELRTDVHLVAEGHVSRSKLSFLAFNSDLTRGYAHTQVTYDNGKKKKEFHRYFSQLDAGVGLNVDLPLNRDLTRVRRTENFVIAEMDADNPDDFVLLFKGRDYFKKTDRKGLMEIITYVNNRMSEGTRKPFYRNMAFPDADEVDVYRKIYVENYITLHGQGILEKLLKLDKKEFRKRAARFIKPVLIQTMSEGRADYKAKDLARRLTYHFKLLKKAAAKRKSNPKAFLSRLVKFFHRYNPIKNGTDFIVNIVGHDQVFVMGQIYGIYPSFSSLQQVEDNTKRRYAGKHWGRYKFSPIRRFMLKHRVLPTSSFVQSDIHTATLFGNFASRQAPNN